MSRPLGAALGAVLTGLALTGAGAGPAAVAAADRPAVVEKRVLGYSVNGRPIVGWRLGDPEARVKAVAIATMHGDEGKPRAILGSLRDGRPIRGIDLWVVPQANPDGLARGRRQNARGVDINRNFPRAWAPLSGEVESGPKPASEPETRALMRFLRRVDPRFVVSFHQPLYGVDVYGPKKRWFSRRLAEELRLPMKEFACGNTCHGTMTQWFNHNFDGVAVTVEYGERPTWERMNVQAPRQLLRALGGTRQAPAQ